MAQMDSNLLRTWFVPALHEGNFSRGRRMAETLYEHGGDEFRGETAYAVIPFLLGDFITIVSRCRQFSCEQCRLVCPLKQHSVNPIHLNYKPNLSIQTVDCYAYIPFYDLPVKSPSIPISNPCFYWSTDPLCEKFWAICWHEISFHFTWMEFTLHKEWSEPDWPIRREHLTSIQCKSTGTALIYT